MEIKPIKTESNYQAALKEIEGLMDAHPETPEGDRLEVMTTLVEAFEAKHYPIEAPDHFDLTSKIDVRLALAGVVCRETCYHVLHKKRRDLNLRFIESLIKLIVWQR